MGYLARLEHIITTGRLVPVPLNPPPDTFWTRSVIHWHIWMEFSESGQAQSMNMAFTGRNGITKKTHICPLRRVRLSSQIRVLVIKR
jgi:hypothetical protein